MVTDRKKDNRKTPVKQGPQDGAPAPNKIGSSTPYDFAGKNLTPYGGLLPVITMLGIVLGLYIGFPRLNQLRFIARDPILIGILKVGKLPVQSSFWRFVNALHRHVARQMLIIRLCCNL
jgi:hypothetical protein